MWGDVETTEVVALVDISDGGALVISRSALPINSLHSVQLTLEGRDIRRTARVRHVRPRGDDATAVDYLVGLEFQPSLDESAVSET